MAKLLKNILITRIRPPYFTRSMIIYRKGGFICLKKGLTFLKFRDASSKKGLGLFLRGLGL